MGVRELLKEKRADILQLAEKYGARNVRVFGSVARGEADEKSDIDFLVDMEPGRSLLDMGGLLMDMRELLGRQVDWSQSGDSSRAYGSEFSRRPLRCERSLRTIAGHSGGHWSNRTVRLTRTGSI